jgi:hypothetical protein
MTPQVALTKDDPASGIGRIFLYISIKGKPSKWSYFFYYHYYLGNNFDSSVDLN